MEVSFAVTGSNGLYNPSLDEAMLSFQEDYTFSKSSSKNNVDLLYQVPTGVLYDKSFYSTKCLVKNVLSEAREITDKDRLYESICRSGGTKFMAKSMDVKDLNSVPEGQVFIVKPTGARTGSGKGNSVVSNNEELASAKLKLREEGFDGGIACAYVTNPLLLDGYKCHFRMMLLVRPASGKVPFHMELWHQGLIRTAKKKYIQGEWSDQGIHDTHIKSSVDDFFFPEHTPIPESTREGYASMDSQQRQLFSSNYAKKCLKSMREAVLPLQEVLKRVCKVPNEAKSAFEVYGCDFLVTDSIHPRPILLEINTKVSYRPARNYEDFAGVNTPNEYWSDRYKTFSRAYFKWMLSVGYIPLLKEHLSPRGQPSQRTSSRGSQPSSTRVDRYVPPKRDAPTSLTKTYLITGGTGLVFDRLREILTSSGYTSITPQQAQSSGYVTFNYIEKLGEDLRNYDRIAQSVKCRVKSVVDSKKNCIADKAQLSSNLKDTPYIAKTWNFLNEVPVEMRNRPLIIKPVGDIADSGFGILVAFGEEDLIVKVSEIESLISESRGKLKRYIISEYITNVDTFNGKKYHLRMYMLYMCSANKPSTWSMWNKGRIVTALEEYTRSDWGNRSIHDTHSKSTSHNFYFPEDVSESTKLRTDSLLGKMNVVCETLFHILEKNNVKPYPESEIGFEVFGCDFLITDTYDPILLEVNSRVGMRNIGDAVGTEYTFDNFSRDYFDWLMGEVMNEGTTVTTASVAVEGKDISFKPTRVKGKDVPFKLVEGFNISKTYSISGNRGFDPTRLLELLKKNKFVESSEDYVGLFILDQKYSYSAETEIRYDSDKAQQTTCLLKNLLDIGDIRRNLANKGHLYFYLLGISKSNEKYLPQTWRFNDRNEKDLAVSLHTLSVKGPVIVKPVSARSGGGRDIEVVGDGRNMRDAVRRLWQKYGDVVVSKYVTNPVLMKVDGDMRKMHLRMYLMIMSPVKCKKCCPLTNMCKHTPLMICDLCNHPSQECDVCHGREYQSFSIEWLNEGRMFTAAKRYTLGEWEDTGIHDTHNASTPENFVFPYDLARCGVNDTLFSNSDIPEITSSVMNHINSIKLVDLISQNTKWVYPESHFGYEVFGADFLLTYSPTEGCVPVLLEINDKPGGAPCGFDEEPTMEVWNRLRQSTTPSMTKFINFSDTFYEWVYTSAIKRVYGHFSPRVTIDESKNTTKTVKKYLLSRDEEYFASEEYPENLLGAISRNAELDTTGVYRVVEYYEDYLPRFGEAIASNTSITRIELHPTDQYELIDTLLESISPENIASFISNGYLGSKPSVALQKICKIVRESYYLSELELKGVSLSRDDMKKLFECLGGTIGNVIKLTLSGVGIDGKSIVMLCRELLKVPHLQLNTLNLSKNQLGEKGGKALLTLLKKKKDVCKELNLYCCSIPDKIVGDMMKVVTVTTTPTPGEKECK